MKIVFVILLCIPFFLRGEWDHFFSEDEDLTLFHQVNVITGNLNFAVQDTVVQGAISLPILRTYSSIGALEKQDGQDLTLRILRGGFLIQGGWSILPHANLLLVNPPDNWKKSYIHLAEPSGSSQNYHYVGVRDKEYYFRPEKRASGQSSGRLNGRQDPQNNLIVVPKDGKSATVILSNGGRRFYRLSKKVVKGNINKWLCLSEEILPSQHRIRYFYNNDDNLSQVALLNPAGNKILAQYFIEIHRQKIPYHFQIRTSDQKELHFHALEHSHRDYLREISNSRGSTYSYSYTHGRKGIGARVQSCEVAGQMRYFYFYYGPPDHKTEKKWDKHPDRKSFSCDKVKQVNAPYGPNGEMVALAYFSYSTSYTDVRDHENLLTRYHHQNGILHRIDHFGKQDCLHSSIILIWKDHRLIGKALLNEKGIPSFSKTFTYDDVGNVQEETVWGNLTGRCGTSFTLNDNGSIKGAESYVKKYRYSAGFNLVEWEEEEGGLSYSYTYHPNTDLLVAKKTLFHGQMIKREFFHYDGDHLCIAEIVDDGSSHQENDLHNVTYRVIKTYEREPYDGKIKFIIQSHWDPKAKTLQLDRRVHRFYRNDQLISQEDIYDATGKFRYSIHYDYDSAGRLIKKSNPKGMDELYRYDNFGRIIYSKEIGKPEKWWSYHATGYPVTCREVDLAGQENLITFHYDLKGRLLSQTDAYGNTTSQVYDTFGNCIETRFPKVLDEKGETYTPIVSFSHDTIGNITSTKTPRGEITQTTYNSHRKPFKIIQADGGEILHHSTKTGLVEETIYPDGTRIFYTYDPFQQITSKQITDPTGAILSEEAWNYTPFQLRSHIDTRGLQTFYDYDGAGRKVRERAEDRSIEYTYDALGFLERTQRGSETTVEIHNEIGLVIQTWQENDSGDQENVMMFEYDKHHQKRKAYRSTSQGEALDLFDYDGKGRLIQHTDPLGQVVFFSYNDQWVNNLGQRVLQKTTIDPLHHRTIETFDAAHRIVCKEKQDPSQKTVFKEEFFYDRSGNLSLRQSHLYEDTRFVKTICSKWIYDSMGRISNQIEAGQKATHFGYDKRGFCTSKRLPSGIEISSTYDSLGRLISRKSSDRTIDDRFVYEKGPEPIEAIDNTKKQSICRSYNLFGDLISEKSFSGLTYTWDYNQEGRCISLTLPDRSSIRYDYEGLHLAAIKRHDISGRQAYVHRYPSYDPNGHVAEESLIGGLLSQQFQRDLLERPFYQTNPSVQQSLVYGPSGLIHEHTSNLFGKTAYTYDALDQLIQENDHSYHFDSFGRSTDSSVNDLHQIVSTPTEALSYDPDGNPSLRASKNQKTHYTYDALGRLISMEVPYQRKVSFTYDPFSRLVSKKSSSYSYAFGWSQEETAYYLYDHDFEIGKMSEQGSLLELKVLGLGLKGDIGSAVALELQGTTYIPIHDFQGHITALLTPEGSLANSYHLTAFGTILEQTSPLQNPWVFASKRAEEGLIYFGFRFYDPSLGRWLTPDPAGFIDGPNLYLYVLNNPLSRLDLFGLYQNLTNPIELNVSALSLQIALQSAKPALIHGSGQINGVNIDYLVSCGFFHKLKFSAEELSSKSINLMHHIPELAPKEGAIIALCLFENGINCTDPDFIQNCRSVTQKIPEGTLFIGIRNPTEGLHKDLSRALEMIKTKADNSRIATTRQILVSVMDSLHKINPELLALFCPHSEGGGITTLAIEGMTPDQIDLCKQHLYLYNVAPAVPTAKSYAFETTNVYSKKDLIKELCAENFLENKNYNIHIIPSTTPWYNQNIVTGDHEFGKRTYQKNLDKKFDNLRVKYGFYDGK